MLHPHHLPVPRVLHVYAKVGLVYKLVLIKNKFAVSDKVITMRINNQNNSCNASFANG